MSLPPEGYLLLGILVLDVMFGDPVYKLHPVRLIGQSCEKLENLLRSLKQSGYLGGIMLTLLLVAWVVSVWTAVYYVLQSSHGILGFLWQLYLGWSLIAGKDLYDHARRVWISIEQKDLEECRMRTGMMVGRDTTSMDYSASGRAAVESLSENLNDGVIAPLFYFILFGIPGMLVYKVVNTLDSMVGYRNQKYRQFGWASARLDDFLNWIPARLTWLLLSVAALIHPRCSGKSAFKVGWDYHDGVASPNAGWCEATAAGALQVRLCGPIWREGELTSEHWLGPAHYRQGGTVQDIRQTAELTLIATALFASAGLVLLQNPFLPVG